MNSVAAADRNATISTRTESAEPDQSQVTAIVAAQNDCLCMLSEVHLWWVDRVAAEAAATAELANRLAGARAPLDVLGAYRDWIGRHEAMLAADSRELAALAENLAELGSRVICADGIARAQPIELSAVQGRDGSSTAASGARDRERGTAAP